MGHNTTEGEKKAKKENYKTPASDAISSGMGGGKDTQETKSAYRVAKTLPHVPR